MNVKFSFFDNSKFQKEKVTFNNQSPYDTMAVKEAISFDKQLLPSSWKVAALGENHNIVVGKEVFLLFLSDFWGIGAMQTWLAYLLFFCCIYRNNANASSPSYYIV